MPTCFDVADFFLANADQDDAITHMALQKMCAYAQAFSLVLLGKRLFDDSLEAWQHGPVIRALYKQYCSSGRDALSTIIRADESRAPFSDEELFILETVNSYYGRYRTPVLRNMSHSDFPGDFGPAKQEIPDSDIVARFSENKIIQNIRAAYQ